MRSQENAERLVPTKYTVEQVEAIALKLRQMPPAEKKKRHSARQETVQILKKEITTLQQQGYSLEQISEALRGVRLDIILTPILKDYLQRGKITAENPHKPPAAVA